MNVTKCFIVMIIVPNAICNKIELNAGIPFGRYSELWVREAVEDEWRESIAEDFQYLII